MPKFRIELEQQDLQSALTLMGQGYQRLMSVITDQLKSGPLPEEQPKANGADEAAERPQVS
jgi:hypothetical protein